MNEIIDSQCATNALLNLDEKYCHQHFRNDIHLHLSFSFKFMARSLLIALLFGALASAAQLAVQSARYTITSDGEQSRTETYVVEL